MKILIADDEAPLRLALRHILGRAGHAVLEAEDGDAALRALRENDDIGLVLIDMIMPRKEGLETILDIRRDFPAAPRIIAMSGGGRLHEKDPLQLALNCGADAVIEKPFEPEALRALVRGLENKG